MFYERGRCLKLFTAFHSKTSISEGKINNHIYIWRVYTQLYLYITVGRVVMYYLLFDITTADLFHMCSLFTGMMLTCFFLIPDLLHI